MNAKIRDAQMQKVPYMLIVGDKELESDTASLRTRSGENLGVKSISEILNTIEESLNKINQLPDYKKS